MKILFATILSLAVILIASSCSMNTINESDGNKIDFSGSNNWMSCIADDTLIREMSIPGTHDTCAQYDFLGLSGTAAAQDLSLSELLQAGVRHVDIRLYWDGTECKIHHGITYQHMNFDDVLTICYNFLDENPTETIIFMIYKEWKCEDSDICQPILDRINANPTRWITTTSAENLTVGECRNKLILVKRFKGLDGIGIPSGSAIGQLHQVDDYKTNDLDSYWEELKSHLDTMMNATNPAFTTVWSSGYFEGQFGIPNIRLNSSVTNVKLENYLDGSYDEQDKKYTKVHFGIIGCDHITKRLAYKIYRINLSEYDDKAR